MKLWSKKFFFKYINKIDGIVIVIIDILTTISIIVLLYIDYQEINEK